MRLSRLDLTRYGKFTDHQIHFDRGDAELPDLHIVFGPNEAGKSTALAAYLDLLYGIKTQSDYAFIHDYASMQIGAALEIDGNTVELVRLKKNKHSLMDLQNRALPDDYLQSALAGMDRQAYCTLYSLDDDTIETGGQSILASEGNLGELLYAASAGIADLNEKLSGIKLEAEQFFKARSRKDELTQLKNELAALKEQKNSLDIAATDYQRLQAEYQALDVAYKETKAGLSEVNSRLDKIARLKQAQPRLLELRTIRAELAPLQSLPEITPEDAQSVPELRNTSITLAARIDSLSQQQNSLERQIESLPQDEAALTVLQRNAQLQPLRSRYLAAEEERPERERELLRAQHAIDGLLQQLGRPGEAQAADLIPAAATAAALDSHARKRESIDSTLQACNNELLKAEQEYQQAESRLQQAGAQRETEIDSDFSAAALKAVVAEIRGSDATARLSLSRRNLSGHQAELDAAMQALQPWCGEFAQLQALQVPPAEDIQLKRVALERALNTIDAHAQTCQQLESECIELESSCQSIHRNSGIASEQQTQSVRADRDRAWQQHKDNLDRQQPAIDSARHFAQLMQQDDQLTAARVRHSSEVARLSQNLQSLDKARSRLSREQQLRAGAQQQLEELRQEFVATLAAISAHLPAEFSAQQLLDWLQQRQQALSIGVTLASTRRDIEHAQSEINAAKEKLIETLAAGGYTGDRQSDLDMLLLQAEQHIEKLSLIASLQAQKHEVSRRLDNRKTDLQLALKAQSQWQQQWQQLCAGCWFAPTATAGSGPGTALDGGTPGSEMVQEILRQTALLDSALTEHKRLRADVAKINASEQNLLQELQSLAGELSISANELSVNELYSRVHSCLQQAEETHRKTTDAQQTLQEKKSELQALHQQQSIVSTRSADLLRHFAVSDLDEVEARIRSIEDRRKLREREQSILRELLTTLQVDSESKALEQLQDLDLDALDRESAALAIEQSDRQQRNQELYASRSKIQDELNTLAGDGEVARLEEQRQILLLDMQERALNYFRQKLGISATEHALRAYRDKHQSSMMTRASEAFESITDGKYTRLTTRLEKDTDVLIGIDSDGSSKLSTAMSKGTRFQLYLALRVAGYYEYARSRAPVPFICDDILETFDNRRAGQTLRLFAEMARIGQVIYLTHHEHLCEMARQVYPSVNIHTLEQ